jgi:branched-chain amino acid transport system ATP-binding protein
MATTYPSVSPDANAPTQALLEVSDLTVRFGGVTALDGVNFTVRQGQICALIGPNGAGKTTAFNTISRFVRPARGRITFEGVPLLERPAAALVGLGISRTFQNLALWPALTVLENVMVGAHRDGRGGFAAAMLGLARGRDRELRARAYAALATFGLEDVAFARCSGLPYGTLKRIELARAIVSRPRLLMLDEPAAGLTYDEVRELGGLLRWLRDTQGMTVLVVEHHMALVMDVSDYVVALDFGRVLVEGVPAEVRSDPRLITAYLGRAA